MFSNLFLLGAALQSNVYLPHAQGGFLQPRFDHKCMINARESVFAGLEPEKWNLINKKHGCQTLEQTIWLWNHTSNKKVYFNEFVANVLHDTGLELAQVPRVPGTRRNSEHHLWHPRILRFLILTGTRRAHSM